MLSTLLLYLLLSGYLVLAWIYYRRYKTSFFDRLTMSVAILLPLGMVGISLSAALFQLLAFLFPKIPDAFRTPPYGLPMARRRSPDPETKDLAG